MTPSFPERRSSDLGKALDFTAAARIPDPLRLLEGHMRSAMTINFVRGLIDGGFADLHHPEYWDLGWVQHSPLAAEYQQMVDTLGDSVRFMETLEIGRAHVCTPVTNAHLVSRLLLAKKN